LFCPVKFSYVGFPKDTTNYYNIFSMGKRLWNTGADAYLDIPDAYLFRIG